MEQSTKRERRPKVVPTRQHQTSSLSTSSPQHNIQGKPYLNQLVSTVPELSASPSGSPTSASSVSASTVKRSRQQTFDSVSTAMESSSTAPTSVPPSGASNGLKSDENANPKTPSPKASQILGVPIEANPVRTTPPAGKLSRTNSLSKPKSDHMQYFLTSLDQPARGEAAGNHLEVNPDNSRSRPLSPGRVPSAVPVLEKAERQSLNMEQEAVRKTSENPSVENGIQNHVTNGNAHQLGDIASPGSVYPAPIVSGSEGQDNSRGPNVKFPFIKKKKQNLTVDPAGRDSRSGSTTDSSTPISVLSSSARYKPGTEPPTTNGVDARNDATWRRDLLVDFENRRLQGRHEHPFEGSTALHQKTNIKSIGLKQLFRSLGLVVKKSSRRFQKLILRRAKTIPNQFNAVVHGNVHNLPTAPPLPPSQKLVTRNQRLEEYRNITTGVLPTFGARVPTPPPVNPISRRGSTEISPIHSQPPNSSGNGALQSPHPESSSSIPHYRQLGLFASQSSSAASNLTGRNNTTTRQIKNGSEQTSLQNTPPGYVHRRHPDQVGQDRGFDLQGHETPQSGRGVPHPNGQRQPGSEGKAFAEKTLTHW